MYYAADDTSVQAQVFCRAAHVFCWIPTPADFQLIITIQSRDDVKAPALAFSPSKSQPLDTRAGMIDVYEVAQDLIDRL